MKILSITTILLSLVSVVANASDVNHQIFKTTANEHANPSVEECRDTEIYEELWVDPTFMDGVSFLKIKLRRTVLKTKHNQAVLTDGYGCIWLLGEDDEALMHYSMETELGDIKANGSCRMIGFQESQGAELIKVSCLLDVEQNETAEKFGIESGTLVSTTVFNLFGPPIERITGSTWILQTWGGKPVFKFRKK
jgi:hypothetical protein